MEGVVAKRRGARRAAEDGEEGTDRAVLSLVMVGAALGVGAAGAAVATTVLALAGPTGVPAAVARSASVER